ncbi:unnamed protein product [Coccothraustes coccothraustes]
MVEGTREDRKSSKLVPRCPAEFQLRQGQRSLRQGSPGAGAVSGLPYEFIVTPPRADGARRVNPPRSQAALARKQTAPVSYRELSEGHCGGTAASACCEGSVPAAG